MGERARLVEVGSGEADPELDGRECDAAADRGMIGIEAHDRLAPRRIFGAFRQFGDQLRGDIVLDNHVIGRHVAPRPVQIGLPHRDRIAPQRGGDRIHHPLDREHPLRPAEAAEGSVGDGVGAETVRDDLDRGEVIAIVRVEHGAVVDRQAQVHRRAAARGELQPDALDPPLAIEADVVIDREIVALAGDRHVLVAIGAILGRAPRLGGDQRAGAGEQRRLALLPAERAAHPPHLDRHLGMR